MRLSPEVLGGVEHKKPANPFEFAGGWLDLFTSAPEALRVGSVGDEGLDRGDHVGFVLRIGDAKPGVVGLEDADVGFAGLDEGIDRRGHVALGFEILAALLEKGDEGGTQVDETRRA
jgi:hypothetical protein